jgi:hypothetical protein
MACSSRTNVRQYIPGTIGGSLAKRSGITQEEIAKNLKEKREYLEQALLLLRKAGFPVDFCTDSGIVQIMTDKWEIRQENDNLTFIIEGVDISQHILVGTVNIGGTGFPHTVNVHLMEPK